ncbi:uncharacterized protein LOC128620633 [Ictalurus furcatus]|uniref:uncharacterized protein LOC128620633 n=1 Tax=Ictalurus furcatus TaxID=66913 RepID=UPI00234FF5EA|nr:uncharacterized protein LOC128620633 [Ictalurus furcatus]
MLGENVSDVSGSSSIFTTMFITVYWHQKLAGSLKRGGAPEQMENLRLFTTLLTGIWAFSITFSVRHFFSISRDILNESVNDCMEQFPTQEARHAYETSYLTLANLVPTIGIVVASIRIAVTLVRDEERIKTDTNVFARGGNAKINEPPEPTSKHAMSNAANKVQDQQQGIQRSQNNTSSSSGNQVRAAKSVMTVATIFLIFWLTHLMLRITITVYESFVVAEIISYIGATYTCIISYMSLHGVKKLNRSSKG